MPVTYRILHSRALHAVGDYKVRITGDLDLGPKGDERVVVVSRFPEALGIVTRVFDLDHIFGECHRVAICNRLHGNGVCLELANLAVAPIDPYGIGSSVSKSRSTKAQYQDKSK